MDNTSIHPLCDSQAHLIDIHLWRGAPQNLDDSRPIQILVNQGYVVGFCSERLQPAWSAYRVADADRDVDYARPLHYYDDMRLDEEHRIGKRTFGRLGGIQLNVGHMTPNEVTNRQFGRLAQMETFMMSNMSPQYGSLNGGVWLKLETAIRKVKDEDGKDHVWVIVGPVFGEDPPSIYRGQGKYLPVPEKYFCIIVDPHSYPYDTPSKVHIDCFLIPQGAPKGSSPDDYPATLEEVEAATNLSFFNSWGRDLPIGFVASEERPTESRIMRVLEEQRTEEDTSNAKPLSAVGEAKTINGLIEVLKSEAAQLQIISRTLTEEELARLQTIQHTISWLLRARDISNPKKKPVGPANLITYKITADMGQRLKTGARIACNFWNRFVVPNYSIVIRLGIFTQSSNTIARAYKPYAKDGVRYGRVEFNTKYLAQFTENEIAGTIIHEIGHSLGIGWDEWDGLFSRKTGKFKRKAVSQLATLEEMEVELDGGSGTALAHWDEYRFDKELMTGYQDQGEYVLPVTIDLMGVLGHQVSERLLVRTPLDELLNDAASVVFSRQDEVRQLDLEHFEETELFENIPHALQVDE
ncbi:DNA/RNA non-specific endonuclease [Hoeflea poritis]|uniref:DNA/RNA non-specific endonuclease n=1 Tax=Hoeflea poritis TaxID=2993659 RepID=A0ABT4VM54_9HYPH|nr:DNA/RNA non-specific endonuclease [Hoeflea poritis]MDA4845740.1 DNA/RNA non-specific endonuclease [Hoeflea poritis]